MVTEIKIDLEKCTGEGTCVDVCPVGMYELKDGKAKVKKNLDECLVCRACEASCPTGAIEVVD
jgi:NAD-dependent dihydropyrimidine dehydrogenase PreA subunit